MGGIAGDFTGFKFGDRHSSDLGITRVSNGSRYSENLLPNLQDVSGQVPGGDGTYYWGSNYTQKPFSINFAFDDLTEQQFKELSAWLGTKEIKQLIFDESDYKYYMAKISAPPQINFICFDVEGADIYKGEGTIQFVCYYPYAKSLSTFGLNNGILKNNGIMETDLTFEIEESESEQVFTLGQYGLTLNPFKYKGSDKKVRYNSKANLLEGLDEHGAITNNLYNEYIIAGDFFKIPVGSNEFVGTVGNLQFKEIYY
jgi:predicted phage tail component-like protein